MMTARMALWHNAYKAECYPCSYLGWRRVYFYKLDIVTRYHQWHQFCHPEEFYIQLIGPKLQRRIFIINYVSVLCFCSVTIFWSCEASDIHMGLKKCFVLYFQAFLCFWSAWQSFIFYGHMSCSVPQSVSSLHLMSLLCMIDTLCPLWRIIRATENVISGLVNSFYCSSGDSQVNRLFQCISQVPVSPKKHFFPFSHLIWTKFHCMF